MNWKDAPSVRPRLDRPGWTLAGTSSALQTGRIRATAAFTAAPGRIDGDTSKRPLTPAADASADVTSS